MMISGVYRIRNTSTGKVYIGSSKNMTSRMRGHRRDLRDKKHPNEHLQSAFDKYGEEHFVFEFVRKTEAAKAQLLLWEQFYIVLFNASNREFGYNKCALAGSRLGDKGRPYTEEEIRWRTEHNGMRGHRVQDFMSPEEIETWKKHISETAKGRPSGMLGKHHSEATKARWRETRKGQVAWNAGKSGYLSDEARAKMSATHKGVAKSEEHRMRIKEALNSPENKARMSARSKGNNNPSHKRAVRLTIQEWA